MRDVVTTGATVTSKSDPSSRPRIRASRGRMGTGSMSIDAYALSPAESPISVYISSTFEDLKDHRSKVRDVLSLLGYRVVTMEGYSAHTSPPVDKCLADVARCDIYIGIFAWRYGFVPKGGERSITEMEYRTAADKGKECLIFLLDDDALWRPKWHDH